MSDRLEAITMFVAIAELENFAEAARQQHKTPTVVTRAVAALEHELKVRLFNRATRAVSLTSAGAQYLEVCRRIVAAYEDLRALEPTGIAQSSGSVSVTAPGTFGRLHVIPAITRFLAEYPQVDINALLLDRVVSLVDEGKSVVAGGVRTKRIWLITPRRSRETQKMPLRTRRSLTRGTPRGLFGSMGLMAAYS